MPAVPYKDRDDGKPAVFKGLTEKELVSVYDIGIIKRLKDGEIIITEGDTGQTVYIVLDGHVNIVKTIEGRHNVIATLSSGSCVGEISFARGYTRTASVVALGPAKIMALPESGLNALPPDVKSLVFRNLNELASRRIDELMRTITELSVKNAGLSAYVMNTLKTRNDLCSQSDMIRQMLRGFRHLPMHSNELSELLLQDRASADDITRFVSSDPSLIAVVLKTANSPSHNLAGKVCDLKQALLLLGFNQVHQAIIDNGVWNVMPQTPEFRELQAGSLILAAIGHETGRICGMKNPMVMNTLGMLHCIGKGIVLLLKKDYPSLAPLFEMVDDSKIGAILLRDWNLPDIVCSGLEYHHYPEFAGPEEVPAEFRETASILCLAHMCHEYMLGEHGDGSRAVFFGEYMRLLGLSETVPEFVNGRLVPALQKKMDVLPQDVREFLLKNGPARKT